MLWRKIKQKSYFVRGQGCNLKRVAREDFIEIVIFKQRLEGSEGASCDPLWEKSICGKKGHIVCRWVKVKAQCGAQLSDDVSLVSSCTFEATMGNLLSPVTEKGWGGLQALLDSDVQMMTSAFHHFSYFSLCRLHSYGRITFPTLSSKSPELELYWVVHASCDHRWPSHYCQGDGMTWLSSPHSWSQRGPISPFWTTQRDEEVGISLRKGSGTPVRRAWRLGRGRSQARCFPSWALWFFS